MRLKGSSFRSVVMRAWGVGFPEAQIFVKGKRPMASPNRGFCEQLRVWQACEYGVEQIVDGERRDKAPCKLSFLSHHSLFCLILGGGDLSRLLRPVF